MYKVVDLLAREVLDSRWNPTIEVEIVLIKDGKEDYARSIVPSGASTGIHEALELRDEDKNRYLWKWVLQAVENVNLTIADEIIDQEFEWFEELDAFLIKFDGTKNKSKFGANAILWVSMSFVAASAKLEWLGIFQYLNNGNGSALPFPMMNIINGGSHADNNVDIQEFMIVPVGAANFHEAVRMWSEVFHNLKKILKSKWYVTSVWDEWWYAPNLWSNEDAFQVILEAIVSAWYDTDQIKLAIDSAASEFYKNGKYILSDDKIELDSEQMIDFYVKLVDKYPIISIEDGLAEDDFDGRAKMQTQLWDRIMLVWDDLLVTDVDRIRQSIDKNLCNAVLIKLNQIGTVSETIDAIKMAQKNNMHVIISHRSWETEDTFIADLAVAFDTWFIKTGSLSRTDRIAKYNQLLRIEERLDDDAKYGTQ